MRSASFKAIAIALAFLTSACAGPTTNDSEQPKPTGRDEVARFEEYDPFPGATAVRLFVRQAAFDDAAIARLSDAQGRLLTNEEVKSLLAAFAKKTVVRPPGEGYLATTCAFVPRHVFRFYDKRNERLGDALVCFECYDLELRPPTALSSNPFPEKGQSVLSIDYTVLKDLMRGMNVPTYELE